MKKGDHVIVKGLFIKYDSYGGVLIECGWPVIPGEDIFDANENSIIENKILEKMQLEDGENEGY